MNKVLLENTHEWVFLYDIQKKGGGSFLKLEKNNEFLLTKNLVSPITFNNYTALYNFSYNTSL